MSLGLNLVTDSDSSSLLGLGGLEGSRMGCGAAQSPEGPTVKAPEVDGHVDPESRGGSL